MPARVVAVSASPTHSFSKQPVLFVTLRVGLGIDGDAHAGATVKHRSRVARDPTRPNLRQVHLIHSELFGELDAKGYAIAPGQLGENITTAGLDLLALPVDTELALGDEAVVRITGLRNPCAQIDGFRRGLMKAVLDRDAGGKLIRKTGVMSVVTSGGVVRAGDGIRVRLPQVPHRPLEPV